MPETSEAYRDGLREGDVIVRVNGEDVRNCRGSSAVLKKLQCCKSSKVSIEVERLPSVDESLPKVHESTATMVSDFYR